MSVFNLHSAVLGDYRDFVRSFFTGVDDRTREFLEFLRAELDACFALAYPTRGLVLEGWSNLRTS